MSMRSSTTGKPGCGLNASDWARRHETSVHATCVQFFQQTRASVKTTSPVLPGGCTSRPNPGTAPYRLLVPVSCIVGCGHFLLSFSMPRVRGSGNQCVVNAAARGDARRKQRQPALLLFDAIVDRTTRDQGCPRQTAAWNWSGAHSSLRSRRRPEPEFVLARQDRPNRAFSLRRCRRALAGNANDCHMQPVARPMCTIHYGMQANRAGVPRSQPRR